MAVVVAVFFSVHWGRAQMACGNKGNSVRSKWMHCRATTTSATDTPCGEAYAAMLGFSVKVLRDCNGG